MSNRDLRFEKNPYLEKMDRVMGFKPNFDTPAVLYLFPDQLSGGWMLMSILATPYILWLLFRLQRWGWLCSFLVFVISPLFIGFSFVENDIFRMILSYTPLINLGVFLFLLKQSYPGWRDPVFSHTPGSDYIRSNKD